MRALNLDPNGENSDEDIKIFHYIGNRAHFASPESVQKLLNRTDLTGSWRAFQDKLRVISHKIGEAPQTS